MNIEQAKELKSNMVWASIVEELDRFIFYESNKLKTCTPEDLTKIQLSIRCYESLKNLPDNVIDRESK